VKTFLKTITIAFALGALALVPTATVAAQGSKSSTFILVGEQESLPNGLAKRVAALGGAITYALPEIGIAIASSSDTGFTTNAAAIRGLESVTGDVTFGGEPDDAAVSFENPPFSGDNDRFYDMQWALDAIDVPEAWSAGARGEGARVAVLDSGIDTDHPDLIEKLNLGLSTSFIPGLGVAAPTSGPSSFSGPPHHGTWTAGIIAAADNGVGTIGVAPEAELVAIRVCPNTGGCPGSAMLAGIVYAANVDADVLNMSIAGWLPRHGGYDSSGNYISARDASAFIVAMTRAFAYAHREGTLSVLAAGNQGSDLDADQERFHLAQLPNTLAVAATGPRYWAVDPSTNLDRHACYSNYGQSVVDLAAPGGYIDPCTFPPPMPWTFCTVVITLPCWAFDTVVGPTVNGWSLNFGTSASAPHVAGVAALVIGANGGQMSPDALAAILTGTADDLGQPGADPIYGQGRINAARAVEAE
jgi:lantibiotic leader peptide-processing serine protease